MGAAATMQEQGKRSWLACVEMQKKQMGKKLGISVGKNHAVGGMVRGDG